VARLQFPQASLSVLNVSGPALLDPAKIELRDVIEKT
jgi:hypothetical protein